MGNNQNEAVPSRKLKLIDFYFPQENGKFESNFYPY